MMTYTNTGYNLVGNTGDKILKYQNCYLTTLKHRYSFVGKWIYIYSEKIGNLTLDTDSLIYRSYKSQYIIPLENITDLSIGHFSRLAKPIRLNYIDLKFKYNGIVEELLFTPANSWSTFVWKTNKNVENWVQSIKDAINNKLKQN